ncbi:MAG: diguanylate cyclase [Deltaproteobacteria bacterium]|nr:diguanylate cyclase [Deltaproteobacteria bacterium]
MSTQRLSQQIAEKIARHFNILFNQATIYHGSHPSIASGIPVFYQSMNEGLAMVSPLTLMLERDSLYLEEWCIDKRVNLRKFVNHFKKAGIQSISFSHGLRQEELLPFVVVFCDLKTYPTVELMKEGLARHGVESIRLNYVIYKKMTTDEEVVAAGETALGRGATEKIPLKELQEALGGDQAVKESLMAKMALDELERSISLQKLLEDPAGFGRELVGAGTQGPSEDGLSRGVIVSEKLRQLRNEIRSTPLGTDFATIENMMQAVFKMRAELMEAVEVQKGMGVLFQEEGLIRDEANALTRQVVIRLIREEYNQGEISIRRLAQILRRMMPDVRELRLILPELKAALLADGMPLADFLKLIKELARELQEEGLVQVLQEASEEVGVKVEELILHIKEDPRSAAELILLAAEIRNAGLVGDKTLLTDLLVDYVERVGSHMAMESAKSKGVEGGKHLHQLLSNIQSKLVEHLRAQPVNAEVVSSVDQKVGERIGATLGKLKSSWVLHQISGREKLMDAAEVIRVLENTLEHEQELEDILEPVRESLLRQGMSDSLFDQIFNDIFSRLEERHKSKQWGDLPSQTFNRRMTLFMLNWEIQRATRYESPFSAILLSIYTIEFQRTITLDIDLDSPEIRNTVLEILRQSIRKVDVVGTLGQNRIFLLLPMTPLNGARVVLERIRTGLKHQHYTLQGIPARVEFCMTAVSFDRQHTPTVEAFVDVAEKSLLRVIAMYSKNRK